MNKMKILVAYDGSSFSDAALDDLLRAGLPSEAEARVVSVSEIITPILPHLGVAPAPPSNETLSDQKNDAMKLAQSAAQRINQYFPEWVVSPQGYAGSTVTEILVEAGSWRPDLIVVGSHGRSAMTRFLLGSVTMSILHGAHCPVRVVRGEVRRDQTPVRNIIGVDGSRFASAAVESVTRREWPTGSEFRLVTCYGPLGLQTEPSALAPMKLRAEEILNEAISTFRAAGLNASGKALLADAGPALIEEAETWKADCIFVGARGLNAFERLLLGSVSNKVAGHAPCAVEVVRYPE